MQYGINAMKEDVGFTKFLHLISGNLLLALEDIMLFCDFYVFLIDTL